MASLFAILMGILSGLAVVWIRGAIAYVRCGFISTTAFRLYEGACTVSIYVFVAFTIVFLRGRVLGIVVAMGTRKDAKSLGVGLVSLYAAVASSWGSYSYLVSTCCLPVFCRARCSWRPQRQYRPPPSHRRCFVVLLLRPHIRSQWWLRCLLRWGLVPCRRRGSPGLRLEHRFVRRWGGSGRIS